MAQKVERRLADDVVFAEAYARHIKSLGAAIAIWGEEQQAQWQAQLQARQVGSILIQDQVACLTEI